MGNRLVRRKVLIVFENRDPNDLAGLLRAVADELRPREVEIHVKAPAPVTDPPARPDEQLETRAREEAAQVLNQRDREVRSAPKGATPPAGSAGDPATKRHRAIAWIGRLVTSGWRITLKVLPVAEKVAKIYKEFHG